MTNLELMQKVLSFWMENDTEFFNVRAQTPAWNGKLYGKFIYIRDVKTEVPEEIMSYFKGGYQAKSNVEMDESIKLDVECVLAVLERKNISLEVIKQEVEKYANKYQIDENEKKLILDKTLESVKINWAFDILKKYAGSLLTNDDKIALMKNGIKFIFDKNVDKKETKETAISEICEKIKAKKGVKRIIKKAEFNIDELTKLKRAIFAVETEATNKVILRNISEIKEFIEALEAQLRSEDAKTRIAKVEVDGVKKIVCLIFHKTEKYYYATCSVFNRFKVVNSKLIKIS